MGRLFEIIKDMAKSLRFLLPLVFIMGVIVAFYIRFTKADAEQTVEDIIYMTTQIREGRQETLFRNFNNDTMVYSSFLPIDIRTRMSDKGYLIRSRFGSDMWFMDAYKTKDEKDYYLSIMKDKKAYDELYNGTGAYIISFPHIRRNACMLLAQTDWKKIVPNFLGIEVGRVDKTNPAVGVERLNQGVLDGLGEIDYSGQDNSFVANRVLQYREAFRECKCFLHNECVVSLKFF